MVKTQDSQTDDPGERARCKWEWWRSTKVLVARGDSYSYRNNWVYSYTTILWSKETSRVQGGLLSNVLVCKSEK
jgi:hypothetical protein